MAFPSVAWRAISACLAAMLALVAVPATAADCTATPTVTGTLTSQSSATVKAGQTPQLTSRAGLNCPKTILVVLGTTNYVRAKVHSTNNMKLVRSGSGSLDYVASSDTAQSYKFTQDGTTDYMQNNLLNLLGLLGGSSADLPLYITLKTPAAAPPQGTYTDTLKIDWSWYLCPALVLGSCVTNNPPQGTATTTVNLSLNVTAQNVTMSIASTTTWDPVNLTSNPKALPGSRRRATVTVTNNDPLALEGSQLAVVIATPAGTRIALDGDGASSGAPIRYADGAPASSLAVTIGTTTDTTDDIDFSSDGGATWTFYPQPTDVASESAVTHVRVRPRGTMAKQSNFTISLPYLLKN
jgi:hypothetical protein